MPSVILPHLAQQGAPNSLNSLPSTRIRSWSAGLYLGLLVFLGTVTEAQVVERPAGSGNYFVEGDVSDGVDLRDKNEISVTVEPAVKVTKADATAISVGDASSVVVAGGVVGTDPEVFPDSKVGISAGAGSSIELKPILQTTALVEGDQGQGTAIEFRAPGIGVSPESTNTLVIDGLVHGDIKAKGDLDTTIMNKGVVEGDITLGSGENRVSIDGTIDGSIVSGTGDDVVNLGDEAQVLKDISGTGNISSGDGNNITTLSEFAVVSGSLSGGSGDDTVSVSENATILGLVALGDGDNSLEIAGRAAGGITTGSGDDLVNVATSGGIIGLVELGGGENTVSFLTENSLISLENLAADPTSISTLHLGGDEADNTYDVPTTGFASLVKSGSGEWILATEDNTFSSGITVNEGKLTAMGADRLGDSDILNNSEIVIWEDAEGDYRGNLSGSGGITKRGSGETTLAGTNTHQGVTTVENGTLVLAGGAAIPDQGEVEVELTGALVVQTAETVGSLEVEAMGDSVPEVFLEADLTTGGNNLSTSIAGNLSGVGGITKTGTGVLTLSGVNINKGPLAVVSGTVSLVGGQALDFTTDVSVSEGATLEVASSEVFDALAGRGNVQVRDGQLLSIGADQSDSEFDGIVSGAGGLEKLGAGTVTLNAGNTFTGGTVIQNGTLALNGALRGDVEVTATAILAGSGVIDGSVDAKGVTSPGNSQGPLTVSGDYIFGADATFRVELDNESSDILNVGGTAGLSGTMALDAARDFYEGENSFDVLRAGAILGTFDSVTGEDVNLFVDLATTFINGSTVRVVASRRPYESAAVTDNQKEVARVLDAAAGSSDVSEETEALLTTIDYLPNDAAAALAFTALSPQDFNSLVGGATVSGDGFADTVKRQLRDRRSDEGGLWGQLYRFNGKLDSDKGATGYEVTVNGLAAGYDFIVSQGSTLGITAGYSSADIDPDSLSKGEQQNIQVGGYFGTDFDKIALDVMAFYAKNDVDFDRLTAIDGNLNLASSDTNSSEVRISTVLTYKMGDFSPYGSFDYSRITVDGFLEKGSNLANLTVSDLQVDRYLGEVGLRYAPHRSGVRPIGYLGYRYDFNEDDLVIDTRILGQSLLASGRKPASGAAVFGLGVEGEVRDIDLFATYDGKFGEDFQSHQFSVGFRW